MKKLLVFLGVFGLTSTASFSAVACAKSKHDTSNQEQKSMAETKEKLDQEIRALKQKVESFEKNIKIVQNGINNSLIEAKNFFNNDLRAMSFRTNATGEKLWLVEYDSQPSHPEMFFVKTPKPKLGLGIPKIDQIKGWPKVSENKDHAVFQVQHTFIIEMSQNLLKVIREILLANFEDLQNNSEEIQALQKKLLNNLFLLKNDLGILDTSLNDSQKQVNILELFNSKNNLDNDKKLELNKDVKVDQITDREAKITALKSSEKVSGGVTVIFAKQFWNPPVRLSKTELKTWESTELIVSDQSFIQDLKFDISNNLVIFRKKASGNLIIRALGNEGVGEIKVTAKNALKPSLLKVNIYKISEKIDIGQKLADFKFIDVHGVFHFRDSNDRAKIEEEFRQNLGSADLEADGIYLHSWKIGKVTIQAFENSKIYHGWKDVAWNLKLLELWGTPNSSSQNNLIRDGLKGYFYINGESWNIDFFDANETLDSTNDDNTILNGFSSFLNLKLVKNNETKETEIDGRWLTKDLNGHLQRMYFDFATIMTISSSLPGVTNNLLGFVRNFDEEKNEWMRLTGDSQQFLINEFGKINKIGK